MGLLQGEGGEDVRVGDVAHVGEVEEVVVRAELEFGLALLVGGEHVCGDLGVAFAEDAGGAEGQGEEVWAVGCEHGGFRPGFGGGVVFLLAGGEEDRELFGGVDEVGGGVVDDGGGGGVDKGVDRGAVAGFGEEGLGAVDVDGVVEGFGGAFGGGAGAVGDGWGGGGVDYYGGFDG